jgi:hypothetical protein
MDLSTDIRALPIVQEPLLGFWPAAKPLVEEFVSRAERVALRIEPIQLSSPPHRIDAVDEIRH